MSITHGYAFGPRHSLARSGAKLETDLPTMQRDAKKQTGFVFECDRGTGAHIARIDRSEGFRLALPSLQLVGDCR